MNQTAAVDAVTGVGAVASAELFLRINPDGSETLADGLTKARAALTAMADALVLIRGNGCENFTTGSCISSGRTRSAQYSADGWCSSCVAHAALTDIGGVA